MSRRRMITSDIWEDEKITTLDFEGRLIFIGLITLANDFGKLRGNPAGLKVKIFPFDKKRVNIERHLTKLHELGIIQCYEVNGEKYIKIINWTKYQVLTYKGKDNIPEPIKPLNGPLINPSQQDILGKVRLDQVKTDKVRLDELEPKTSLSARELETENRKKIIAEQKRINK